MSRIKSMLPIGYIINSEIIYTNTINILIVQTRIAYFSTKSQSIHKQDKVKTKKYS